MLVTSVVGLLVVLLLIGTPIGFALGMAGAAGLWRLGGVDTMLSIMSTTPYRQSASWILTAVPLFVLMAELLASSRVTSGLFAAAGRWVGHMPGGVAIAAVLAAGGLGAVSGSSTATTAALSNSVTPELLRQGYSERLAVGTIASAGTLATMIPPSIILVIYGISTETSIGALFVAGIVPGLLTILAYSATILILVRRNPAIAPMAKRHSWRERFESMQGLWPVVVLFALVIGTLYSGAVTVTESAGLGAAGATFLTFLFLRRKGFSAVLTALQRTAGTTAMIFSIIIGAHIFGYFMTLSGAPQQLLVYVSELGFEPWGILIIILLIYLFLGCCMDQIAILVLTLPIVFPLIMHLGYNPIWFGIVLTKTVEIGLITPPLGMNCFIASSGSGVPLVRVFQGVTPFLIAEVVTLILLAAMPSLVTWAA